MDDSCSDDIYHAVKCRNLNEEKQWHGGSVFYLLLCTGIGLSDYCGMLCISGNVGWILKISMYMGVRYIFTSIMLVIILVCIGAIVWKLPLLVFFAPGPIAFLMSEFLERVLKKHEPKVEEGGTAE